VGLNLTAISIGEEWIFVDCGLLFPSDRDVGVDAFIPRMSWFEARGIRPSAWLITHGHEDHIGALPWLVDAFPAPIYAPEIAAAFIDEKLREVKKVQADVRRIKSGESFLVGGARVTPISVAHSFPDSCGYLVETPHGNVMLTGDFRSDTGEANEKLFAQVHRSLAGDRLHLLLADSTNALVSGHDKNEEVVVAEMTDLMNNTVGKVAVVTFASSLWRFRSVLEAARASGRRVLFLGRSVERNAELAKNFGMFTGFEDVLFDEKDFAELPNDRRCVLASGSQGEIFSAAFRLAHGHVKDHLFGDNDLVILSSRTIPGREKSVSSLLNHFARRGVRIITAHERCVHVSGHGFSEDICHLIRGTNPSYYMPIHGEYRQLLANGEIAKTAGVLAENIFVVENGEGISLLEGVCKQLSERVEVGKDDVCAGRVVAHELVRERNVLANGGAVFVVFVLLRDGSFACDPSVILCGVDANHEHIQKGLPKIFAKIAPQVGFKNSKKLAEALRLPVRRFVETLTEGARPLVSVCVEMLR
jgi:ribonuclease J